MKWIDGTIGDLISLQRGYDLPESQRKPGDIPVVGSAGINGYHNKYKVVAPGVTLGRSGASIGKVTFVNQSFWPHNATLFVSNFKGNNPRFVAYLLSTKKLEQLNSGAAQPSLNRNFVYTVKIHYPDIKTQQKIANILSKYDDLIENNRRRIELLEESARSLYREWFVYLRFPGHEHTPIIDGIPEGWEKKKLGDVVSLLKRGITPTYDDHAQSIVINQKCIRNHLINLQLARHQSKSVPQEKILRFGDILINSTGTGTLGRVAQFLQDIGNCTIDSHVTIVRPEIHMPKFYLGIFLGEMESYLSSMGRGATNQTELSCSTISEISVLIPSQIISQEFEDFVSDVFSQIDNLIKQNQKLEEARDLLLPRLMNGEIAV